MKNKSLAILQIFAFITMITMNALANILPINGMNTGQLSALYPNLFVPAGFTFGIWGVIYSLLLAYLVFSSIQLFKQAVLPSTNHYRNIALIATINFFLNAAWILAWHYQQLLLSLIIMLGLLATLTIIYLKNAPIIKDISLLQSLLIHIPFIVYLAWICVATIANTTAVLVHFQWGAWGFAESAWSVMMMRIAFLLAAFFGLYKKQWAFCLVIAWALFGIYMGQFAANELVCNTAKRLCISVSVFAVIAFVLSFKKVTPNKKPI
jgi:hypothetical protein